MADNISPLAQRLAEAYNVDLSKLREKQLEGKITARSVLDYLNAADNDVPEKRVPDSASVNNIPESRTSEDRVLKKTILKNRASSGHKAPTSPGAVAPTTEPTVAAEAQPTSPEFTPADLIPADLAPTDEKTAPKKESKQEKPEQKEPVEHAPLAATQGSSAEAVADTVALAKARAQLQVTAKVHQQALMQVGSLREQNTLLEAELTFLRVAEAQTRSQLEAFQKHDEPLEVEVEATKRRGAFAWLRRLFS